MSHARTLQFVPGTSPYLQRMAYKKKRYYYLRRLKPKTMVYLIICSSFSISTILKKSKLLALLFMIGCRLTYGQVIDMHMLENVLVKYPNLKLYLMHAGENFYQNTLRMMDGYTNLYADLGVELWLHPLTKDYAVKLLKSAKEYGVLDRVMFGSDQMVWP
ncbi:MAG TPA: amidohydrolase family protein [Puia sp.]